MRSKWHVSSLLKNKPLIVLAHSARTIAQAGAQAGYKVIAIDAFSDLETQAACLTTCRVPMNEWRFDLSALTQSLDQLYRQLMLRKLNLDYTIHLMLDLLLLYLCLLQLCLLYYLKLRPLLNLMH